MKNIVVSGYPKSGNTWLTRLVAELLECPVSGFWGYDSHPEIAIEGKERNSNYSVYKSHHIYDDLSKDPKIHKIIYIIRDPRDIVISGIHYFPLVSNRYISYLQKYIILENNAFNKVLNRVLHIKNKRIKKMTDILLNGDPNNTKNVGKKWCCYPWENHVIRYEKSDVLIVKYEDLLSNTKETVTEILNYLSFDNATNYQIEKSIEKQSFSNKKNMAIKDKDKKNILFLRSGKKGEWKSVIPIHIQKTINLKLKETLLKYNYPTE